MRNSIRTFPIHELWPEAIVVFPQGLPTPGITDPDGQKPGWQKTPGDQNDRDLKLFDSLFDTLQKSHTVDLNKVYSIGHSNGGAFCYLLASERRNVFSAIAPSASIARGVRTGTLDSFPSVIHFASSKDPIVPYRAQVQTIEAIKKTNACQPKGEKWEEVATLYRSPTGRDVVTFTHDGGHKFPTVAPELAVKFFKAHLNASKEEAPSRPKDGPVSDTK